MTDDEDPKILRELAAAGAEHRRYAAAMERARARRDALIVKARAAGCSLRQIAKAAGVHYTRVRQITTHGPSKKAAGQKKRTWCLGPTHQPRRSPAAWGWARAFYGWFQ